MATYHDETPLDATGREAHLREQVEELENRLSSMVSSRDLTIRALTAERDRLATDSGIKSLLLEQVADGTLAPTRDAIQARHDALWAEAKPR
jgi:hypothetical protein